MQIHIIKNWLLFSFLLHVLINNETIYIFCNIIYCFKNIRDCCNHSKQMHAWKCDLKYVLYIIVTAIHESIGIIAGCFSWRTVIWIFPLCLHLPLFYAFLIWYIRNDANLQVLIYHVIIDFSLIWQMTMEIHFKNSLRKNKNPCNWFL